jgi:hypothetical protein
MLDLHGRKLPALSILVRELTKKVLSPAVIVVLR